MLFCPYHSAPLAIEWKRPSDKCKVTSTEADKGHELSLLSCRFPVVATTLSLPSCRFHVVATIPGGA